MANMYANDDPHMNGNGHGDAGAGYTQHILDDEKFGPSKGIQDSFRSFDAFRTYPYL
jgi:hypothetical protein